MRIPRIYTNQPLATETTGELTHQAAHYVATVLRLQPGRELLLFNGQGGEYNTMVAAVSKKSVTFTVTGFCSDDRQSPLQTTLAIGLSKGDRFDWVIQKATELGVSAIQPLFTERTEVKLNAQRLEKKMQHWQQVMISACEQCQRNRLVTLHPPMPLNDYLGHSKAALKLLLHPTDHAAPNAEMPAPAEVTVLVGPEGGFSDTEVTSAQQQGFQGWTLGPRILRTETAPIAALSLLQSWWGDWGSD